MAAEDILQFDNRITDGKIMKLDAHVGGVFPSTYKIEYKMLKSLFRKHQCGRMAVFKNHSKIYTGYEVLFRNPNKRKHKHQSENRKRMYYN